MEAQPAAEPADISLRNPKKIDRSWILEAAQPLKTEPVRRKRVTFELDPLPNKKINLSSIKTSKSSPKYSSSEEQKKTQISARPRVIYDLDDAPKPPRNRVVYDLPESPKQAPTKNKSKKNKKQKNFRKNLYY